MTSHLLSLHDCYDSRLIQKEKYHCPKWTSQKASTLEKGHDAWTSQGTNLYNSGASLDDSRCFLPKTGAAPNGWNQNVKQLTIYVAKGVCVCVCINVYIIIISIYPPSLSFLNSIIQNDERKKNANVLLGDFSSTGSRDPDPSIGPDSSLRALRRRSAFRMAKVNLDRWILSHRLPLQCRHRSI